MKVVHIGPFSLGTASGHFAALWSLACAQVSRGQEVTLLRVGGPPKPSDVALAGAHGIKLDSLGLRKWIDLGRDHRGRVRSQIAELSPDVAHLFYVRIPQFLTVAHALRALDIPYVVSTHGGVNSMEMTRHRWRKSLYWSTIERSIHARASGLHFVSEGERSDYVRSRLTPTSMAVIPNIVELPGTAEATPARLTNDCLRLLYAGRYDVWHKGLDLAVQLVQELARRGVMAELNLYGSAGDRHSAAFQGLVRGATDVRIVDHGLVSRASLSSAFKSADVYLQYSRFEVFGLAPLEAMARGVPVAMSVECDLTPELSRIGAIIALPLEVTRAATTLMEALADKRRIQTMTERGRSWIETNCSATAVTARMTKFYEEVIRNG